MLLLPFLLLLPAQAAPHESDPCKGLSRPVDLDLQDIDTRAAFQALFRQSGSKLYLPESFPEKKISCRVKGVTFLEAVDALCRLNGSLRYYPSPTSGGELHSGPWTERPVSYRRPFRLSVYDTARIRELRYPIRGDRTDVTLVLQWADVVQPMWEGEETAGKIRVSRAEDDTGRSLLPPLEKPPGTEFMEGGGEWSAASYWIVRLQPAAPGARKIASLDAEWEGRLLSGVEEATFENPEGAVGKLLRVGWITVTLVKFERNKDESSEYSIRLSSDPSAPAKWKESLKEFPLEARILTHVVETILQPAGCLPPTMESMVDKGEAKDGLILFSGNNSGEGKVTDVTFRVAKEAGPARASFSLRDVLLPEEPR